MARPLRIEFPDAWYHVINRGANHQKIFLDNFDRRQFLELLHECHDLWAAQFCCWCLLENHYHLLIRTPRGNLAQIMRHLDGLYTQRFNKKYGRDGPLLRGRYKSTLVDHEAYGLCVSRYIHLNPVKAKIVSKPEDYPWSSYRFYLEKVGPAFLHKDLLLGFFGDGERALREFQRFTKAGVDEKTEKFYASKRPRPILGGNSFLDWVCSKGYAQPQKNKVQLCQAMTINPPSLKKIIRIVAEVYEVPIFRITAVRRGQPNEARNIAIYLGKRLSGKSLGEIAKMFGGCGYQAISKTAISLEQKLLLDPQLRTRVEEIRLGLISDAQEVEVET